MSHHYTLVSVSPTVNSLAADFKLTTLRTSQETARTRGYTQKPTETQNNTNYLLLCPTTGLFGVRFLRDTIAQVEFPGPPSINTREIQGTATLLNCATSLRYTLHYREENGRTPTQLHAHANADTLSCHICIFDFNFFFVSIFSVIYIFSLFFFPFLYCVFMIVFLLFKKFLFYFIFHFCRLSFLLFPLLSFPVRRILSALPLPPPLPALSALRALSVLPALGALSALSALSVFSALRGSEAGTGCPSAALGARIWRPSGTPFLQKV